MAYKATCLNQLYADQFSSALHREIEDNKCIHHNTCSQMNLWTMSKNQHLAPTYLAFPK